jgi:hypothetical protein
LGDEGLLPIRPLDAEGMGAVDVERVQRREEQAEVARERRRGVGSKRLALDRAIGDPGDGLESDVLEVWNGGGQRRAELREQGDLDLEGRNDSRAPREAEDPLVVGDQDLEVVARVFEHDARGQSAERLLDDLKSLGRRRHERGETIVSDV